ncbi:hypothetical protein F3Y22_tig00113719pilonHSYRG00096 [Hibiscus syriacus]|uniref:C2 domain-containing protein n=1 Tax=Hibiscus syriacus TaxID=106335 RepID=A0A6A2WNK3_HIBSY|nr:hypothetical protein F3Y22_tig00113719pilonHSYRG00096 [Hibiscus syriacus]
MASPHEMEVTFSSARGLKNVNWRHGPIRPYVVVWVDPNYKCSTRADEVGDTDPTWDETIIIPLPGPIDDDTILFVDVVHAGSEEGTKPLIGSARLKLREVLDDAGFGESYRRTLQLKRPSGRPQGKLDVKVLIRESRYRAPDQYEAHQYRVPPSAAPHPSPYGYPYDMPPSGYPYYTTPPPPRSGSGRYHYGQEGRKSKFGGMGMGTGMAVGAVAGVLGGLALAEGVEALEDHIAEEAAERVEDDLLGYDVDVVGDDF